MTRGVFSYYKKSLINLIISVQELNRESKNNLQLCKEIQLALIRRIFYIEHKIRVLRNELNVTKQELHKKHEQPLSKDRSRNLKAKIKTLEERISDYHELRKAFKSIGDAIAFTYIDKWSIKQFAQKEEVGFLSGKEGFNLEIKCFHIGFDHGKITILHDITNCLKHADISYFKIGKPIVTLECKSRNGYSKRGERQLRDANEIYEFLRTDEKEVDGYKVYRTSLNNSEVTYSDLITSLIGKSIKEGGGFLQIEEGLYYLVTSNPSFIYKMSSHIKHPDKTINIMLNDMKFNTIGYLPFTLSIQNPEYVYKFFNKEFVICVLIDIEEIRNRLVTKALNLEMIEEEDYIFKLKRITDGLEYLISNYLFLRVPFEFLSLSWFIDELIDMFENPHKEITSYLEGKD